MQERTQREELLHQLRFNQLSNGSENPLDVMMDILENVTISKETLLAFHKIRESIIEQKAYHQFSFSQESMYRDVAADASLWGQLALLDVILKTVKLAE